ncbi:AAA family ATPase [Clostridium sp.]|uniref:AAA family ATPase n=1 Tax=Clostridium sp. TaxID=1506 RepID=UPI002FC9B059
MELTLGEVKPIINYIVANNIELQKNGEYPIAINICGNAGVGKTAIIRQLAKEMNANFIFLSLAQLSDPAELCGWPIKEHYVCKDGDCT